MPEHACRDHDEALTAMGPVIFGHALADLLAFAAFRQLDGGAIRSEIGA
jgi:hypothetical protein